MASLWYSCIPFPRETQHSHARAVLGYSQNVFDSSNPLDQGIHFPYSLTLRSLLLPWRDIIVQGELPGVRNQQELTFEPYLCTTPAMWPWASHIPQVHFQHQWNRNSSPILTASHIGGATHTRMGLLSLHSAISLLSKHWPHWMSYDNLIWRLRRHEWKETWWRRGAGVQAREDWLQIFTRALYLAQGAADLLGWLLTPSPERECMKSLQWQQSEACFFPGIFTFETGTVSCCKRTTLNYRH